MPITLNVLNAQTNKLILEKNLIDYILHEIHYCLSIRDIINLMCVPLILIVLSLFMGVKNANISIVLISLIVTIPFIIQIIIALRYLYHKII